MRKGTKFVDEDGMKMFLHEWNIECVDDGIMKFFFILCENQECKLDEKFLTHAGIIFESLDRF